MRQEIKCSIRNTKIRRLKLEIKEDLSLLYLVNLHMLYYTECLDSNGEVRALNKAVQVLFIDKNRQKRIKEIVKVTEH